jgi:hypothetical protein
LGGDGADVVIGIVQSNSEITLENLEDGTLTKVLVYDALPDLEGEVADIEKDRASIR